MTFPIPCRIYLAEHEGSKRTDIRYHAFDPGVAFTAGAGGAQFRIQVDVRETAPGLQVLEINAEVVSGEASEVALGICIEDESWSADNYVMIPGAVYAGNRFQLEPCNYPPPSTGPQHPGDALRVMDIPRLSLERGPSHLDQMSIDAATPGLGVFFPVRKQGLWLLTDQESDWGCFNLEVLESEDRSHARMLVGTPGIRHDHYFSILFRKPGGFVTPSTDRTADFPLGSRIRFNVRLHSFDCETVQGLFDHLFEHRTDCFDDPPLKNEIPFSSVRDIIVRKQNQTNWREEMGLYQTSILGEQKVPVSTLLFQTGWCGGGINTLPMLVDADAETLRRCLKQMALLFSGTSAAGLFFPYYNGSEWNCNPGDHDPNPKPPWTLTRRAGDALYFLLRQLMVLDDAGIDYPDEWRDVLRRNTDALVRIWRTQGDLGHYLDVNSGEVKILGTTSGALVPAALMIASEVFDDPKLERTAEEIAEHYRVNDLASGIHCGGPGDALQAPDSESICLLLESFALLYQKTGAAKWRQAACDAAAQAASWALSYDYRFPEDSTFAKLGIQSRGAFFANAQNKTGVPGICTHSGQGFLRAYRATGDWRLLEFLKEICHSIPQYMGRKDKKIHCSFSGGNLVDEMPEGWICERVNVTQWGEPIGELFAYTTWCEISMLLVWMDIPGIYVDTDSRRVIAIDHVQAVLEGDGLRIINPTAFPARVRVLMEGAKERANPLGINESLSWPVVDLEPGAEVFQPLEK